MNIKDELKQELRTKRLSVRWTVSSDIVPSWIGSKREICFYLDSAPIRDNSIHSFLEECLIDKLNIPSTSQDDMIEGKGDLFILNNVLYIDYCVQYSIPYDYPHKHENGKMVLISDI